MLPPLPLSRARDASAGQRLTRSTSYDAQPTSFILLGNRSLASLKLSPPDFSSALADAEAAVALAPTWAKGHVRRGEALEGLGRVDEAVKAFEEAVRTGSGTVQSGASLSLSLAPALSLRRSS